MFHSDQIQNGDGRERGARERQKGGIKRKKKIGWLNVEELIKCESNCAKPCIMQVSILHIF